MLERQLNLYSQGRLDRQELVNSFSHLSLAKQKEWMTQLIWFIQNTRPSAEEISQGLINSGLKTTYTAAIILSQKEWAIAKNQLLSLPDHEILKTLIFLASIFKISDSRRRNTECKNGCQHEWHNL